MLAVIAEKMGGQGGQPIQDRNHLEVPLEDRVRLGVVDGGLALRRITRLLLEEGRAEDVLGSCAPLALILITDPHQINGLVQVIA